MLKKVIPIVIVLCLIFGISAMAENTNTVNDEPLAEASAEMSNETTEAPRTANENMRTPPSGDMQNRGKSPAVRNGEMPAKGVNREQRPTGNFSPSQNVEVGIDNAENSAETFEENGQTMENPQLEGRIPGGVQGGFSGDMQNGSQQSQVEQPMTFLGFVKTYSTPIISVILLISAFFFVIFYRRKNY